MTLYKRILLGILFISFCLIGLIFINAQLILMDSYQQLEEQNATQNIDRLSHVLQNDIDNLRISDIDWVEKLAPIRSIPELSYREFSQDSLLNRLSLDAKLSIALLLDHQNKVVFQSAVNANSGKATSIPKALLASVKPGSPLVDNIDSQSIIKGIIALSEGPLMTISVPVYPQNRHDTNWGRLIGGRYIDDAEIEHLADSTNLNVKIVAYNTANIPDDFLRAKNKLDTANHYYVEPVNNQLISSYTTVDDIYGKPAIMLRAQMPRFISQYGQNSITSFFISLLIIVILLAAVAFLLLERTVLSRLNILNIGLARAKSANSLILEVFTTGNDEIATLTNSIKDLFKAHTQTRSQLQDAKDTLEQRVIERTTELTSANIRLEQELDESKQANQILAQARDKVSGELQLKSQLLANVSHDSRTPLTIIGLNTEMLQQGRHGELNSKQTEVLDRILNATRQLLNFVTNMLDEAQLKHGKMPFVTVTFEPKLLIEEFVSMLEPLAEAKGIKLKAELDLALPSQIKGDPDRLKQILTNLSENAIKFTDCGSVTIKAERTDRLHWTISVIDTGSGIPAEAQSRIFEAYWQLNSTSKSGSNRGVGLGLSIVKQVVQLMKGSISVTSKVGEGTTFVVTLPIEEMTVSETSVLHLTN
jgi:signal transduction histidine kinase